MIAVDTNILVYAHRRDMNQHAVAAQVVRSLAEDARPWAIAWPCVHEFFATVTGSRMKPSTTPSVAFAAIRQWVASPSLRLIGEGLDHLTLLARLIERSNVRGGMIHDARIAAICLAHGVTELWTADRDFSRFPDLKTRNPLK